MSIGLKLIRVCEFDKCTCPLDVLDLNETNLVEYFIENRIGTFIGKKDRLFYSEDPELSRFATEDPYGVKLKYIKTSDLNDIPKDILKGKDEAHTRRAIEYLRKLDGFIILWFT